MHPTTALWLRVAKAKADHTNEMIARKGRRAAREGGNYDRATARSVIRSVRRKMAGRWDGKP